jgi:hypothetical protein
MPLVRGRIWVTTRTGWPLNLHAEYDEIVPCEISSAAKDELAGKRGTLPAEREAQFCVSAKRLNALRLTTLIATLLLGRRSPHFRKAYSKCATLISS